MFASDNPPLVISVVRNHAMYRKCIEDNEFTSGCQLLTIDNSLKNEAIPILYNRAIKSQPLSNDRWFVFAHEDFEPLENLAEILSQLDTHAIWGPIGAITVSRWPWFFGGYRQGKLRGRIQTCRKDGTCNSDVGTDVKLGTNVETLDCMFLAVHSSLLRKNNLTFDEHLTFDLYAEDFSMQAMFAHGITTRIVPFRCKHHSVGKFEKRFHIQRNYLKKKYPNDIAVSTTSYFLGGGGSLFWRLQILIRDKLPR